MKLSDFADLATAQAHPITVVTNKVTSGKARSFFLGIGKWTDLRSIQKDLAHPLFPLADGIIGVINESSYFGLDPTTTVGQANLGGISVLVSAGFLTQPQADAFIAMGTSTTFPFKDVTQSEFDATIASELLKGEQLSGPTLYEGGEAQKHHPRTTGKNVRIFAYLDAPATLDTKITVNVRGCSTNKDNTLDANYLLNENIRLVINVKKGALGGEIELRGSTARWLRFDAVADVLGDFHLEVESCL